MPRSNPIIVRKGFRVDWARLVGAALKGTVQELSTIETEAVIMNPDGVNPAPLQYTLYKNDAPSLEGASVVVPTQNSPISYTLPWIGDLESNPPTWYFAKIQAPTAYEGGTVYSEFYKLAAIPNTLQEIEVQGTLVQGGVSTFNANLYFTNLPLHGNETVTYAWTQNGTPVGENSNVLELDSVPAGDVIACEVTPDGQGTFPNGTTWTDDLGSSRTDVFTVSYLRVFGVKYTNGSPVLTRLTPENDPNGLVTASILSEPVIGTDGTNGANGTSPFDSIEPFETMGRSVYGTNDGVNFTEIPLTDLATVATNYSDILVKMKEHYQRIITDGTNGYLYFSADGEFDGAFKVSERYIGKYAVGTGYASKSGVAPIVNETRATFRQNIVGRGIGATQYDFITYSALCLLFVVENLNWDSQTLYGNPQTPTVINSGSTNSNVYCNVKSTSITKLSQWRNLEGLFKNVFNFVDGVNIENCNWYVSSTPSLYDDVSTTTNGYSQLGVTAPTTANYIAGLQGNNNAGWLIPNAVNATASTMIPDRFMPSPYEGIKYLYVGGEIYNYEAHGLFALNASNEVSHTFSTLGSRLVLIQNT